MMKIETDKRESSKEETFIPPKAPSKDQIFDVAPAKTTDPNSEEERKTIKPLS